MTPQIETTREDREAAVRVLYPALIESEWTPLTRAFVNSGEDERRIFFVERRLAILLASIRLAAERRGHDRAIAEAAKKCEEVLNEQEDHALHGRNGKAYPVAEYRHAVKQLARVKKAIRALGSEDLPKVAEAAKSDRLAGQSGIGTSEHVAAARVRTEAAVGKRPNAAPVETRCRECGGQGSSPASGGNWRVECPACRGTGRRR